MEFDIPRLRQIYWRQWQKVTEDVTEITRMWQKLPEDFDGFWWPFTGGWDNFLEVMTNLPEALDHTASSKIWRCIRKTILYQGKYDACIRYKWRCIRKTILYQGKYDGVSRYIVIIFLIQNHWFWKILIPYKYATPETQKFITMIDWL